ncbi:MAG: DUF4301 family protein [Bacteroidota bacterium]
MLTKKDLQQLKEKGISPETLNHQLQNFQDGFPYVKLQRPAIINDGIRVLKEIEANLFSDEYEDNTRDLKLIKFVPASGAASRMFKSLFEFTEWFDRTEQAFDKLNADRGFQSIHYFLYHLENFAFYDELRYAMAKDNLDLVASLDCGDYNTIIEYLLSAKGLDYGSLPKGLLRFHSYPEGNRTSIEEHLVEGAMYARNVDGRIHIHFTLSPEHIAKFDALISTVIEKYEMLFDAKYVITHSIQKPSTDTLAVELDNEPFREVDGSLLFRPAGHGALLENLNDLDADIVFIKNIDNVVPDKSKAIPRIYKRALASILIKLKEQTNKYLNVMAVVQVSALRLTEIATFAAHDLSIQLPAGFNKMEDVIQQKILFDLLDRPIRICGMVKNVGEPGGGPFWVTDAHGNTSLQVVESSQVNINDAPQQAIFNGATHFNPVDLVCTLKDYRGQKFDLQCFVDPETGFISTKSKDGRALKAQELPGLWNGAMAKWTTLFVEVPIVSFNPVKTINDLLREEHR